MPITSDEIRIQQGMLEDSNVNSMLEMTRMITATRAYESVHRALSRIDKLDENNKRKDLLIKALGNLNEREKDVFIKRCLDDPPSTLEKLSKIYNVSRERIRQIEVRCFEKVKKTVLETAIKENKETLIKKKN